MKTYVKPAMMALSISANDMLCGNCTKPTRNDMDWILALDGLNLGKGEIWVKDNNNDGAISESETNLFAAGDDCQVTYENYCKFSGADDVKVFTS